MQPLRVQTTLAEMAVPASIKMAAQTTHVSAHFLILAVHVHQV